MSDTLTEGLTKLDLVVTGGAAPILSVLVGDEADTLRAGKFLFDQGFYVQSVHFPAVPYHGGMIRIQCNANHTDEAIDRLIDAFAVLKQHVPMPSRSGEERDERSSARLVEKGQSYLLRKSAG